MRLFLGIDLPNDIKSSLESQVAFLKDKYPDAIWVPKQNYHLTVYFIGEIESQYIEKLKKLIEDSLYDASAFELYSGEAGIFMKNKITMYLSFLRSKQLEHIVENVREKLLAPESNDKFFSHITLARTRIPSKQQYLLLKKTIERAEINVEFPVKELTLFESILSGRIPEYKPLARFELP